MELLHENKKNKNENSSQKYVEIDEIKNGVVVMKNGSLRMVLLVSSINFDLKSTEEQDAIISQYQNFLNSLDFPVQIVLSSRRFNINPYLEIIKEKEKIQKNELLRMQIAEYGNFIKRLTDSTQVMSKFFYVVVPFSPVENKEEGFFGKLMNIFNPKQRLVIRKEFFDAYVSQLWQRSRQVEAALSGAGLKMTPLGTQELIELYYNAYNPNLSVNTIIKGVENLELE
jgi:type IV secretory pathway VirB4 component